MQLQPMHVKLARTVVFGTVSFFSVIILGVSAHWIATTETKFILPFYDPYAALALAVSLLSLFTLPVMLIIDRTRKGAFTSTIVFEVSWLGTLTVLWLATASYSSSVYANSTLICLTRNSVLRTGCSETRAIVAFAHLNWLWLFFYVTPLTILSLKAHNHGKDIWQMSIRDVDFSASVQPTPPSGTPGIYEPKDPMDAPHVQQMPVLQNQYPPQQGSPYYQPAPAPNGQPQV